MTRNILLTSLEALGDDRSLQYYAAPNELSRDYCDALQSAEAASKYILSRFPIDEILVIGEQGAPDAAEGKPFRLKDDGSLYKEDPETLSAFSLFRYRIAQYIDELSLEQEACETLLPEPDRAKLTDYINGFLEQYSKQETKRLNRLFDELANNRPLYEQFRNGLVSAVPENRDDLRPAMKWAIHYLYTQLKASAKLEILPENENVCARCITADKLDKQEYWLSGIPATDQENSGEKTEINVYVAIGNASVVAGHLVLNMLNILVSTPGSNVRLKKIFQEYEPTVNLTGSVIDSTVVSRSTDLVAAAHAFLNYSKTDMLVDFWESTGQHDERISRLIYAARHVDVGISMCNMMEVHQGIRLLRELLSDERSWAENGEYGPLFGILAGCIQADYAPLLAEDSDNSFIELIKWAYQHHLYQQVLTLIESHAPTSLVNSGIFYYCEDEAEAEKIINLLAEQRLQLKPYEYYKIDEIDHYFVKHYDRGGVRLSQGEDRNMAYATLRAQSLDNQDPKRITGYTACSHKETVKNVLYAYFHLGEVRNKISHADFSAMAERRLVVSENDLSYAMITMQETIEYFIMCYEKALDEVRGTHPKIVTITPGAVRKAADRISHERFRDGRRPDAPPPRRHA